MHHVPASQPGSSLPVDRHAGHDPTLKALRNIAQGCRVFSAATLSGGAMLRNTFGVAERQTHSAFQPGAADRFGGEAPPGEESASVLNV